MGEGKVNPFMSSTIRGDTWQHDFNAPYTKQTFNESPGPGQYLSEKKKVDGVKNRLLQEEPIAFNN